MPERLFVSSSPCFLGNQFANGAIQKGWHSPKRKTARKSVRRVEEVVFSHEPVAEESVFDDPMWRAALRDAHRAARQVNEGEE